jgi:hypothetical protein
MKRIFTGIIITSLALTAVITISSFSGGSVNHAEHGRTLTISQNL